MRSAHATLIGRRRDGRPIYLAQGAASPAPPVTDPAVLPVTDPLAPPTGVTFTAEDIERARSEERDKLHRRLTDNEKLRQQVEDGNTELARLRKLEEDRTGAAQAEVDRLAAATTAAEEMEMSAKELLARRDVEWATKLEAERAERLNLEAVFNQERKYNELIAYRERRLGEVKSEIDPRFIDYIRATTPEGMEAEIATAVSKTQALAEEIQEAIRASGGRVGAPAAPGQLPPRSGLLGAAPTGMPASGGPLDQIPEGSRAMGPAELNALTMDEYIAMRPQLMGALEVHRKQHGLYGG